MTPSRDVADGARYALVSERRIEGLIRSQDRLELLAILKPQDKIFLLVL